MTYHSKHKSKPIIRKPVIRKPENSKLRQSYPEAYENAELKLERHPLSPFFKDNPEWLSWAEWMVSDFQRGSSAVEGRNVCLSQLRHNGRGFPDISEWVIERMGELPVPRNSVNSPMRPTS